MVSIASSDELDCIESISRQVKKWIVVCVLRQVPNWIVQSGYCIK